MEKREANFVMKIHRDLFAEFVIDKVEQKHSRGFPDLVMFDVKSPQVALVEVKVAEQHFYECKPDTRITIPSMKPHQINWLESHCVMGGIIKRNNVGMLLWIEPWIVYIRGDYCAKWRGPKRNHPTFQEVDLMSSGNWFMGINPDGFREAISQ